MSSKSERDWPRPRGTRVTTRAANEARVGVRALKGERLSQITEGTSTSKGEKRLTKIAYSLGASTSEGERLTS